MGGGLRVRPNLFYDAPRCTRPRNCSPVVARLGRYQEKGPRSVEEIRHQLKESNRTGEEDFCEQASRVPNAADPHNLEKSSIAAQRSTLHGDSARSGGPGLLEKRTRRQVGAGIGGSTAQLPARSGFGTFRQDRFGFPYRARSRAQIRDRESPTSAFRFGSALAQAITTQGRCRRRRADQKSGRAASE